MGRDLSQSVVVVTGASSGIGRATALRLARAGARLVLTARRDRELGDAASACERTGAQVLAVPADMRDAVAVDWLAASAVERFGRIDVWINNAAVTALGRFEQIPPEVWRQVVEVDLFGYVNGARAALPQLRERGGTLINVGSVNSRAAGPYATPYMTSKFAVRGFSESLRQELRGDGVAVCTVLPSSVDTPLFQRAANYSGRAAKPLRPMLHPQRVAAAIVRCARRPRGEVVVGLSGRQLILMHDLARPVFERVMPLIMRREHFRREPAPPSPGNVLAPVPGWSSETGGWKDGDASPTGAPAPRPRAAGA
jgi:NAD(P)-dependent dehydrogenase (short-subunit alcohol dehydrogenase family)